jgi:TatD DNase family protein
LLVDSHCHLNYLPDPGGRLAAARDAGVGGLLCVGVDEAHIHEVLDLASREDDVWATVGLHPEGAGATLDWIEPLLDRESVVAVGETGLDYHHVEDDEQRRLQRLAFETQLGLADRHGLPVVIHTRAAEEDTLGLLRAFPGVRGVLHCFTESWAMAEAALELGFYISISGIVTFRNGENVREVARRVPAERLLVETDAPWLAPVPHRGRQNEPAFVADTARGIAGLRGVSLEDLASVTTANFFRLFDRAERPAEP